MRYIHSQQTTSIPSTQGGNIRRHTVGPGDVAHEQALAAGPNAEIINFKSNDQQRNSNNNHVPINLTTLQNLPMQNLTIKDQHLLKPPGVMDASKIETFSKDTFYRILLSASSFGRRASDGGANFHIYYPTTPNTNVNVLPEYHQQQPVQSRDSFSANQNVVNLTGIRDEREASGAKEESIEEVQRLVLVFSKKLSAIQNIPYRYMQMRGGVKRHTVGCTDDLTQHGDNGHGAAGSSQNPSNSRTRRTGLLTVMERPPGKCTHI